MAAQLSSGQTVLRVVDAFRGPHTGWILRTKLQDGGVPALGALKGSRWRVEGSDGTARTVEVLGFPLTGGKPSNERMKASGRIDLHVAVVDGPEDGSILLRSLATPL